MLTHQDAERAVSKRQGRRPDWIDVLAFDVPGTMLSLDERNMVLIRTERRMGKNGQAIVRLWYERSKPLIEHR